MKTLLTATILLFATGCIAYAHPQPQHHAPASLTQAWVWVNAHYTTAGEWQHGHWERRHVERHLLNRHPHTYIRYVEGRHHPRPPQRRHRRRGHRQR